MKKKLLLLGFALLFLPLCAFAQESFVFGHSEMGRELSCVRIGNKDAEKSLLITFAVLMWITSNLIRSATGAGILSGSAVVSAASDTLPEDVRSAVMGLAEAGAYTDVIRTDDGYVIACYSADVPAGEVEMTDAVTAAVRQIVLEEAREAAYDAQMAVWMEEANVQYYPERMQ